LQYCRLVSLIFLSFMLLSPALAQERSPREKFMAGVAAFEQGDLQNAKKLLEQAGDAGLESLSLIYNLGVVYYRLELTDQAEAAFTELLDTPHAPLARYNLGLVLRQRGDSEGARQWFSQAARGSSPEEVQTLARRQLNRGADQAADRVRAVETVGYLSAGAGYDDNIAGTPGTQSTEEAGGFGEVLASARAYLNRSGDRAIRFEAVAYRRQYPDNAEFNISYLGTGLAWQSPFGAGRLVSEVNLSGAWFGGDLLERRTGVDLTFSRDACSARLSCQLRGFAVAIQGGPDNSVYDGRLYGGLASVEKTFTRWTAELSYRLDIDQRDDLVSGNQFFSLSATRQELSIDLDYSLSKRWNLGASQNVRFSRYDDPHRLVIEGQEVSETRSDDQFRTNLHLGYQIDERWSLGMELSWLDNKSTINRYDYNRAEIMASVEAVF